MCDLLASARRCAFRVGGDRRDIMPPAMGQPITVVERPTSTPGLARFELNRSLTGQGHEHYRSVDDVLDDRPVDRLARRLFETGAVAEVHAIGSVVTVRLAPGASGEGLADVIRDLYIFYRPRPEGGGEGANGGSAEGASAGGEPVAAGGVRSAEGDAPE
jgi:hypothetical protein